MRGKAYLMNKRRKRERNQRRRTCFKTEDGLRRRRREREKELFHISNRKRRSK